jgi:HD-like signal output (HDOD) protein
MTSKKDLQSRVEQITNLPTLPAIVSRLMHIVNDPSSSSGDVASIVGQDLALSAKILRLANSAFYGMPRAVTSIHNAVVILGLKVINTIVLSLTVFDMFPNEKRSSQFDRTAFWRHSTSCALICRFLASRMKTFVLFDKEEAFCAGLLHDIGRIVMEQYLHDDFHRALKAAKHKHLPLYIAEVETLGYAHTDVAGWLTAKWDLPPVTRHPMVYHHTPLDTKEHHQMVALCHWADALCYELKLTIGDDYTKPPFIEGATKDLGLTADDIEALKLNLNTELEKVNIFCEIAGGR